jgi:Fe-S-cluster-containing dehydrogenase component
MRLFFTSRRFKGQTFEPEAVDPDDLVMLVDLDRCINCGACAMACRIEHEEEAGGPMRPIAPSDEATSRMVCLPSTCRHCQTPCEYYDDYNFWTLCPSKETRAQLTSFCDSCATRVGNEHMPACATRCTLKTIYFGHRQQIALVFGEKRLREMGDIEFER